MNVTINDYMNGLIDEKEIEFILEKKDELYNIILKKLD